MTAGWASGDVADEVYAATKAILTERLEAARAAERAAHEAAAITPVEVRGLIEEWPTLAVEARRAMLTALIEAVVVTPAARRGLRPSLGVLPRS